jgi:ABC-type branched-subunit amino acid transport system substrate-binding protein
MFPPILRMSMQGEEIGRREFLRRASHGCAALVAGGAVPRLSAEPLRIGLVAAGASVTRGVTLGVEEAARTGTLFGRSIELVTGTAESLAGRRGLAALVGGSGEAPARAASAVAERAGVLFLNAGTPADALRGCGRNTFHVEASAAMYAAAGARAVLWHPSLERFGAAQLNDRFRARFGGAMDGPAWAGWMAVKVLWEASLRARSTQPAALRAYLARGDTRFDGHKGWPLSFRAWDRQLRQPLYRLDAAGKVAGEVPARGAAGGASSGELLDRLGAGPSASTCRGGTR